jgi:hypothetical protein
LIVAINAIYNGWKPEKTDGQQAGAQEKKMKITKSKLLKIIKEEIEAARSEGGPINDPAFLSKDFLIQHAQKWVKELMAPAREAAESGGEDAADAQRFLDKVGDLTPERLIKQMIDDTLNNPNSDPVGRHMSRSLRRDRLSEEE